MEASEKLIKSKKRVKRHGEVFTPKRIVNEMLNQPEIKAELSKLGSKFLEPAAGEGSFLREILKRKLKTAKDVSNSLNEYHENALLALSSIYGIELLEDNLEMLVMNLYSEFERTYYDVVMDYSGKVSQNVLKSARTIISANMAQGNALTKKKNDEKPIVFSEWVLLPKKRNVQKVQRIEYTLDAIIQGGEPSGNVKPNQQYEEIDLFEGMFEDEYLEKEEKKTQFVPVKFIEVYKELIEEIED